MTNAQEIKIWLEKAQKKGARYLIVGHDTFDMMADYPIYVMPADNFWERMPQKFGTISDQAHEVYDLELDIDSQLKEYRAWHPPAKV